jgi:membrane protease YdiL (CAAX protease family)
VTKRRLWTVLILLEFAYVGVSTWASLTFRQDPTTGELIRTAARLVSLGVYWALTRHLAQSAAPKRTSASRELLLWLGLAALLAYPLFWGKDTLTGWTAVLWFWSSFVVGFREEYFYRRLVQNELESRLGLLRAVLITTALFTGYHVYYFLWGYWWAVSEVVLFSLAIGTIYAATRSFLLVALFHGLYDAVPLITPFSWNVGPGLGLGCLAIGIALAVWYRTVRMEKGGGSS